MAALNQSGPGQQFEEADGTRTMLVRIAGTAVTAASPAKAEDAAAASADAGIPAMAVQTATPADAATAGDYAMLQMAAGRLHVSEGPYPANATPIQASSGNVAAASAVATLDSDAAKTTYIAGFEITGAGATVGLPVVVTVAGLLGGTRSYIYAAATGVQVANQPLVVSFVPPLPASAADTDIVVTCPSLGAGNTNNIANAYGYKL